MARKWILDQERSEWVRLSDQTRVHSLALLEFEKLHHETLRGVGADGRLDLFLEFKDKDVEGGHLKKPVQAKSAILSTDPNDQDLSDTHRATDDGMPDNQADGHKDPAPTDCCMVCGLRVPRSESDAGDTCRCPES